MKLFSSNHPNPQFARPDYLLLNGEWEFEIDNAAQYWKRNKSQQEHLKQCITVPFAPESPLSAVARKLGYSHNYLSHWIRRAFGMNYCTLIGSIRVEKAKYFLKETDTPIIEIAIECGFTNIRSFQRHFKSISGKTPIEYRKSAKTNAQKAYKDNDPNYSPSENSIYLKLYGFFDK